MGSPTPLSPPLTPWLLIRGWGAVETVEVGDPPALPPVQQVQHLLGLHHLLGLSLDPRHRPTDPPAPQPPLVLLRSSMGSPTPLSPPLTPQLLIWGWGGCGGWQDVGDPPALPPCTHPWPCTRLALRLPLLPRGAMPGPRRVYMYRTHTRLYGSPAPFRWLRWAGGAALAARPRGDSMVKQSCDLSLCAVCVPAGAEPLSPTPGTGSSCHPHNPPRVASRIGPARGCREGVPCPLRHLQWGHWGCHHGHVPVPRAQVGGGVSSGTQRPHRKGVRPGGALGPSGTRTRHRCLGADRTWPN
ncbi:hypothetical protein Q9966_015035 [Columba livia]|nr:hypothetical protein Q9966_015035 [Columba livia]